MKYQDLIKQVRHRVGEGPPLPLPAELELQALWFSGAFGREFTDTSGGRIRIIQFGEWNRSAGPDFVHAVIEHDGEHKHGAVELDTSPSDWEAHGHGADPAFNEVVLHVVFQNSPVTSFTRNEAHQQIPQVVMPPDLLEAALQLPASQTAIARPGRCVTPLAELSDSAVRSLLEQAALHRAEQKAARFMRTAEAHGRDAALFHATAETLGYRSNSLPMKLLVQRMTLGTLKDQADAVEALLFGAAGFLSSSLHEQAPQDTREHLRELWDRGWMHRTLWESSHPLPWKMHGQRPANHPHRRVGTLVALVRHWAAYRKRALARPFSIQATINFLTELSDPFWSHRHTLTSKASIKPIALFGKAKAVELLANHLIPLALLEDPDFSYEAYLKLPGGTLNEKVRRCGIRLFGSEEKARPWTRKAAHQQALLQIYQDFCLRDLSDCDDCPFPEQLAEWSP